MEGRFYESFLRRTLNQMVVSILKGSSHLPFFVLYGLSDFLYIIVRFVFRYRKKVIVANLKHSFPEKSGGEIARIVREFYRHFCDVLVESIKIYSISKKELEKRIQFKNIALFDGYYDQGKSAIIVGMHFNNWEWCSLMQDKLKHHLIALYNPIRGNKSFEDFLLKYRCRYHSDLVPVHKSSRAIIDFTKSEAPQILWLLADQSPHSNAKFWIRFLNQETAFFSGPEKIASRSGQPIVFEHVKKIGRGRYEVYHYPVFETYYGVEPKDILIRYARKMEEIIRENPEYYLWSHRRWKHKRPENLPLLDE